MRKLLSLLITTFILFHTTAIPCILQALAPPGFKEFNYTVIKKHGNIIMLTPSGVFDFISMGWAVNNNVVNLSNTIDTTPHNIDKTMTAIRKQIQKAKDVLNELKNKDENELSGFRKFSFILSQAQTSTENIASKLSKSKNAYMKNLCFWIFENLENESLHLTNEEKDIFRKLSSHIFSSLYMISTNNNKDIVEFLWYAFVRLLFLQQKILSTDKTAINITYLESIYTNMSRIAGALDFLFRQGALEKNPTGFIQDRLFSIAQKFAYLKPSIDFYFNHANVKEDVNASETNDSLLDEIGDLMFAVQEFNIYKFPDYVPLVEHIKTLITPRQEQQDQWNAWYQPIQTIAKRLQDKNTILYKLPHADTSISAIKFQEAFILKMAEIGVKNFAVFNHSISLSLQCFCEDEYALSCDKIMSLINNYIHSDTNLSAMQAITIHGLDYDADTIKNIFTQLDGIKRITKKYDLNFEFIHQNSKKIFKQYLTDTYGQKRIIFSSQGDAERMINKFTNPFPYSIRKHIPSFIINSLIKINKWAIIDATITHDFRASKHVVFKFSSYLLSYSAAELATEIGWGNEDSVAILYDQKLDDYLAQHTKIVNSDYFEWKQRQKTNFFENENNIWVVSKNDEKDDGGERDIPKGPIGEPDYEYVKQETLLKPSVPSLPDDISMSN